MRCQARAPGKLEDAVQVCTAALEHRYGPGPVDGKIQAHVVAVAR